MDSFAARTTVINSAMVLDGTVFSADGLGFNPKDLVAKN